MSTANGRAANAKNKRPLWRRGTSDPAALPAGGVNPIYTKPSTMSTANGRAASDCQKINAPSGEGNVGPSGTTRWGGKSNLHQDEHECQPPMAGQLAGHDCQKRNAPSGGGERRAQRHYPLGG